MLFRSTILALLLFAMVINSPGQMKQDAFSVYKTAFAEKQKYIEKIQMHQTDTSAPLNILYHKCQWNINPNKRYISGNVFSLFTSYKNTNQIIFNLSDSLTIDSVLFENQKIGFIHTNNSIFITLENTLLAGRAASTSVYYRGIPPKSGFGSFVQTYHDKQPVIWTLSEPYGAQDWWPCKQNLNDKIDSIDIYITTPQSFKAVSNGKLISVSGDSLKTWCWKHRYPIAAYLVGLAATNYDTFTYHINIKDTSMEILNFVYPEAKEKLQIQGKEIINLFDFYNKRFIPYPFYKEKYGHAQCNFRGGMEHQTISFMGDLNYKLMAHELAHHWFGNYITCKSWQEIWLNEGFAEYFEGMTNELQGTEMMKTWAAAQISMVVAKPDGSVWVDDTASVERIFDARLSYIKGSLLLHMLRNQLGESCFFSAIKNYLNDENIAYRFATTNDLKKHLEMAADTNLTEFFNDWYYGQGYPIYTLFWKQNQENELEIEMQQTATHASVNFFEMNVPLLIEGENIDTTISISHLFSGQKEIFRLNFIIKNIVFDPDKTIITKSAAVINTNFINKSIAVYPNPFHDFIMIYKTGNIEIKSISVQNLAGSKVFETTAVYSPLNLNFLNKGFYLLKIESNQGVLFEKILKL